MPRKLNSVQDRIKAFKSKCNSNDDLEIMKAVREALRDRHYLLVTKAANLSGESLLYDLEEDLLKAYHRLLNKPVKNDPNCSAKSAIARALVAIDCQNEDFFIAGLRYRQHEPVWGGSVDTAIDIRASCAIGLVNTSYPRALIELVTLLYDPEAQAREGAARAIAYTQPLAAEAVLRAKALAGDSEPGVIGAVMASLFRVAHNESRDFVSGFLDAEKDPLVIESIAFALGESKIDEALDVLRSHWDNILFKRKQDYVLLHGAIFHRSEKAFSWLLDIVADGDKKSARFVIKELSIYRTNKKLYEQLQIVLNERDDDVLTDLFHEIWR